MLRRIHCLGVVAAIWAGATGCTTCHNRALETSLSPIVECEASSLQRNRVHTFIVNGDDPLGFGSFPLLPERLNANGYAMIHTGQVFHGSTFEAEIRRLHRCEPESRFVLVGGGFGAGTVDGIARRLAADAIPVDGVVLVAPLYLDSPPSNPSGPRRVVINPLSASSDETAEVYRAPGVNRFSLPGHPVVEAMVLDMLRASAMQVSIVETAVAVLPLQDDPAPLPTLTPDAPRKAPVQGELVGRPK